MVTLLLEAGDDVEVSANDGSTPLLIATAKGHSALALFLLERGANPEGNFEKAGYTPLMWAVCTFEPTQITYKGIEAPGEWNTFAGIPDRAGKFALIKELVKRGADVNRKMKGRLPEMAPHSGSGNRPPHAGATPFIIAAQSADAEMMRLLLALGADPKARANDDQTAVMAASEGIVENAVLLTQDLDFGELFVRGQLPPLQVVLLRTRSGRPEALNRLIDGSSDTPAGRERGGDQRAPSCLRQFLAGGHGG
jgi:predicted nuclease of predicted toxin-antitoxin system